MLSISNGKCQFAHTPILTFNELAKKSISISIETNPLIPREMRADAINYSVVRNDFTILFTQNGILNCQET